MTSDQAIGLLCVFAVTFTACLVLMASVRQRMARLRRAREQASRPRFVPPEAPPHQAPGAHRVSRGRLSDAERAYVNDARRRAGQPPLTSTQFINGTNAAPNKLSNDDLLIYLMFYEITEAASPKSEQQRSSPDMSVIVPGDGASGGAGASVSFMPDAATVSAPDTTPSYNPLPDPPQPDTTPAYEPPASTPTPDTTPSYTPDPSPPSFDSSSGCSSDPGSSSF